MALAHTIEALARQPKLKPLDQYLPKRRRRGRAGGRPNNNALVAAHLDAIAKRKEVENGG